LKGAVDGGFAVLTEIGGYLANTLCGHNTQSEELENDGDATVVGKRHD